MDIAELERLLVDLESDRVERKPSLSEKEKIWQAICAFANDLPGHQAPGYIFVGVDDRGNPLAIPVTDQLLRDLAAMRSENILPLPSMNIQKVTLRGAPVAVVEVSPSDLPPVRYRGQIWIRVGSTRAIANLEEERRLTEKRISGTRTFDQRPCMDSSIDDLAIEPFRNEYLPKAVAPDVLAQNQRGIKEQLASLRFFELKRDVPTYGGYIAFAKDPLTFVPGAYVQFVRFDGSDLAAAVQDQKEVSGNLATQLAQLYSLLPAQIHIARVASTGLTHEERPDYPLIAVRELALNAIMHRSYEGTNAPVRINWFQDRIEIQNPGGLYGQVTPDNYRRACDYRNPVLAECMKVLGYVERFGTGIARANAALLSNGNPEAEFTFEATHVLVVLRRRP